MNGLQKIALNIGDINAFAPLPEGPHTLRLYPDVLDVVPIRSSGVLFDTYHDGIIEFVPRSNDNVLFTSNAYIRYPMTVEVYIADVRLSSESDCSNALNLARDGLYQPGDLLMIPILPGTSVLCMNIAGADVVIHLEDVLAQSVVSSIPSVISDGRRATSGASTFIGQDGTITVTVTGSMRSHLAVDRSVDYTDVMVHTGRITWLYDPDTKNSPVCSRYSQHTCENNLRPDIYNTAFASALIDASNDRWDRWRTATTMTISGDRPTLVMNVYRNGELLETQQVFGSSSSATVTVSNVDGFSMDQSIRTTSETLTVDDVVAIDVKKGDFVQVELVADSNMRAPYHGGLAYGYSFYPYSGPGPCSSYGVGLVPLDCRLYMLENSVPSWRYDWVSLKPVHPDPKPIINVTQTKQLDIVGGYVIFAGN